MINRKNQHFQKFGDDDSNIYKVRLSVKIGEKLIESDIEEVLFIPTVDKLNPTVVANMMAEIPSIHARWNFLYNEAVYEYDMLKIKFDIWYSKKSQEYRRQLTSDGKKTTEKMVEDMIRLDPEFKELNEDVLVSKKNMKHILAQANGFGDKGDKIVSIASMMKWEAENLGGSSRSSKEYKHIQKNEYEDYESKSDPNKNDGWPIK